MIDKVQINRDMRKVVLLATGMTAGEVRPANQTDAPPSGARFATVFIMENDGLASANRWANEGEESDNVIETQETHAKFTASVQFFREGANTLANKLRDRITLTSALQLMRSLGMGYVSSSTVRDTSAVVSENWEERASVDIDFYVVSTETDVVATFGQFPITVTTGTSSTTTEVNEP